MQGTSVDVAASYQRSETLTFAPHQMRALLGESSQSLKQSARVRVEEATKMLTQSGWLDGWE
jgi:hypothetical protein